MAKDEQKHSSARHPGLRIPEQHRGQISGHEQTHDSRYQEVDAIGTVDSSHISGRERKVPPQRVPLKQAAAAFRKPKKSFLETVRKNLNKGPFYL